MLLVCCVKMKKKYQMSPSFLIFIFVSIPSLGTSRLLVPFEEDLETKAKGIQGDVISGWESLLWTKEAKIKKKGKGYNGKIIVNSGKSVDIDIVYLLLDLLDKPLYFIAHCITKIISRRAYKFMKILHWNLC